jgi:acyl carrier protein
MNREEAVTWLAGLFEEPPAGVREDTARESIAGWDSLGTLSLMAEMDEKFDIQLSEKDVTDFQSIGDVVNLLAGRGKLS